MFSPDGGWMELNDSWYLNRTELPTKYFKTYNDFMDFCFIYQHWFMGFYNIWIDAQWVGDAKKGVIDKDYKLIN